MFSRSSASCEFLLAVFRVPLVVRGPGQDHQLTPARFRVDLFFIAWRHADAYERRRGAHDMKTKHDLYSAAHLAAPPTPLCHPSEPGQSPPSSLLLSSLTTALGELSGAGEHTIDRASGVQEQASERLPSATVLWC